MQSGKSYEIQPWLATLVQHGGSDLHVKAHVPPKVRVNGELVPLAAPALSVDDAERVVLDTIPDWLVRDFKDSNEADFAVTVDGLGRFRVNAMRSQGSAAMVLRHVRSTPRTLTELGMPEVLSSMSLQHRGLLLVTGPTGSGKTTTLAGMVDLINANRRCHILTIEDPIEILHRDKLASVNQREIRTDTADFKVAMRAAMRQDPDVILIGEMRDPETVDAALAAAETGHFVLSTLHTKNAAESVARIIDFFPPHEQQQVRYTLAASLQGIVCQRLVERQDGAGRVAVMEVAVNTPRIAEAIAEPGKTGDIETIIAEGEYYGMQTFDQHLLSLVLDRTVAVTTARRAASNLSDFDVHLKRVGIDPTQYPIGG